MRLCCNDTGVKVTEDLGECEQKLRQLRDIGFRAIGVFDVAAASVDTVHRFRDLADRLDMTIAMSPTGYQPAHPDVSRRPQEHEGLRDTLSKMRLLGADLIHIAGGSYDGTGWWYHPRNFTQEGLDDLVEEMKQVAPYAEEAGVCVCPETTQWCILNSLERMKEYVDRVGSPYVKITFDVVNHMLPGRVHDSGSFMRDALQTLGDRIGQLHVKDVDVDSGLVVHLREVPVGAGLLDHEAVVRASDLLEPWKVFSLEHFNEQGVDKMLQRARAFEYLREVADRIGHTWSDPELTRAGWLQGRPAS